MGLLNPPCSGSGSLKLILVLGKVSTGKWTLSVKALLCAGTGVHFLRAGEPESLGLQKPHAKLPFFFFFIWIVNVTEVTVKPAEDYGRIKRGGEDLLVPALRHRFAYLCCSRVLFFSGSLFRRIHLASETRASLHQQSENPLWFFCPCHLAGVCRLREASEFWELRHQEAVSKGLFCVVQ